MRSSPPVVCLAGVAVVVFSSLVAGSCAARAKAPALPAIADADRLVTTGCYRCLEDALKIYETLLAKRPSPAASIGAFRTTLLLAIREKELGLGATTYLGRARSFADALRPSDHAQLAMDVASALPWDLAGLAKEFTEEFIKTRQAAAPQVAAWREQLRPLRSDSFFAYLEASLACSYGDWRARDAALEEIAAAQPASLLVKYRLGACVMSRRGALEDVLAAEPRYAEAHLFLGRYALIEASNATGRRSVIAPHLNAAYAAFPASPSVTFTLAGMYRAFNKLKEALQYYDQTLAIVPKHREALLGRTIALTYTGQPDEAISTATRMIELGEWYIGDAYYWRAFNLHEQKKLDAARDDVERAKSQAGLRADVFLLAGIIYYDRRELETAAANLRKAWQMNDTACDAAWYLGLVRSEQKGWEEATLMFPRAAACYRATADVYRAQLGQALKTAEDEGERAAIDADYERLIDQQLVSEARSYYNAGYAYAQRGDREHAVEYATLAEQHPYMKEKAAEFLAALKKNP